MQRIYKMQFFSVDTRYPLLNLGTTVLITEFKTYTYKEKKWPSKNSWNKAMRPNNSCLATL